MLQLVCRKWYDFKIPAFIRSIKLVEEDNELFGPLSNANVDDEELSYRYGKWKTPDAFEKAGPLTWRMMQAETKKHGMEPIKISPKTHKLHSSDVRDGIRGKSGKYAIAITTYIYTQKDGKHHGYEIVNAFNRNVRFFIYTVKDHHKPYGFCRYMDANEPAIYDYLVNKKGKVEKLIRCFLVPPGANEPQWFEVKDHPNQLDLI